MTSASAREELFDNLHRALAAEPDLAADPAALARRVRAEAGVLSDIEVLEVLRKLRHDTSGLGLIDSLVASPGVSDVVVNGPDHIFVDRGDGLVPAPVRFADDHEVRRLASRLIVSCGGRLDDASPYADGKLSRSDGTALRIHAVLAPPAQAGTCISVRVLRQAKTSVAALCASGTVPEQAAQLLKAIIAARLSFVVIGGTGAGKTTLLSALLALADPKERIVIIEDTAELQPNHPHTVSLVSRRANTEGLGEITMSTLLQQALRMRPDRIVVGEIRGKEVVDLLAALNTGHDGSAGTLHANSLSEVPARLEALAALGGLDRPALHSQLAAAVDCVLAMRRRPDGQRQLYQIGWLRGNPVRPEVVWQDGDYAAAAEDFIALLAARGAQL